MYNRSKAHLSIPCWGIVIFLLLVFFAQMAFSSRQLSLTSDEPPNLGVGYTYLTTGETWYISSLGQPPLLFAWEAVLVTLSDPHISLETLTNWHEFPLPPYLHALFPLLGSVEQLEVLGRAPMMLLGMLLGGLVFRWAADLFGTKGGILALALMVFDPTVVAHTPLATGDVGTALIGFAMFFVAWRWVRARRAPAEDVRWAIVVGLLGGATMAAKVSGFVWVGLLVGILAVVGFIRSPVQKPGFFRKTWFLVGDKRSGKTWFLVCKIVIIVAVAFLFLWGIYGFHVGSVRLGAYVLTLPASHHWEGLIRQVERSETRMMYLAGEAGVGGWWWYFPFAFLIKNPIPLLVIWSGGIVISLLRRSLTLADILFLLAFPVVYMALSIRSGINIGYRHILPIHPFLYILAAQWAGEAKKPGFFRKTWFLCAQSMEKAKKSVLSSSEATRGGNTWFLRLLWIGLWIWYVVGTLRIFPHYLAYFNELVGGPRNGYHYLVDSNLDWGQSFKTLKKELDRLNVLPPLRLGHYWYAGPELYGVEYEPIPPLPDAPPVFSPRFDPPPGTYVLGATLLYSGPGDLEQYEWFKHHSPVAQPGYAMFVYQVDPREPPATWIAQCVEPAAPLTEDVIEREFHTQPLRRVYFDCTQSWIYPEDGRTSGWYALQEQVLQADEPFLRPHLNQAHLAYVHSRYDGIGPAFSLYEYSPAMQDVVYASGVRVAASGMSPGQMTAERPVVETPLHLDGPLDFLGYRLVEASPDAVEVETWWQVNETYDATARPLSIMAHLVDSDGNPVGVADGLGVPVEVWQAGDVLVQYHRFPMAPEQWQTSAPLLASGSVALTPLPASGRGWGRASLWLQTGVYWLDTLERHAVSGPGPNTGDHILIGEIRLTDETID